MMGGKLGTSLQRFEWSYIPEPNSGCWLWLKSVSEFGYGWFYYPPRNMVAAHIVAWELFRGSRCGLQVLHNCDNPYCVNPDHLRLGTHQDNMRDRDLRGRQYDRRGSRNGRAKLSEDDVIKIRADKRWQRFVARDYGVSVNTIQRVRKIQSWNYVK